VAAPPARLGRRIKIPLYARVKVFPDLSLDVAELIG
jgi:hypothetical protein